jgi:hypothetical protein
MTNDLTTLSGALLEMKDQLIYELGQKGVTASYDSTTGLLGLIGRIADIQTGGGSCYHIEFTEDSYVAISNVATVTIYLQENYAPKTGASVTITGGSSTVTATTDSDGIATANVTVTSATTLTATYSNVSDTASVTVRTYLINDDASSDNSSSLFGSSISLRSSGSNTTGYNNNGYYTITTSGSNRESMRVLNDLTGVSGDFVFEYDSYTEQTDGTSGLVIYNGSSAWEKLTDNVDSSKRLWYGYHDGSFHETALTGTEYTYQKWVHYKYTLQGTSFKMEVFINDTLVFTDTETIHFTRGSSTQYGFNSEWGSGRTTRYKNIQAYLL